MIQFQLTDGIVLDLVKGMSSPEALHVLIIDEMNRANLPKVFGELMFKSQGTFLTQSLCELAPAGFRYHNDRIREKRWPGSSAPDLNRRR